MSTQAWKDAHQDEMRAYRRKWYKNNTEHAKEKTRYSKDRARKWFIEYKSTLSCYQCGENHPACLDFHHRDPITKEIDISVAVGNGWSTKRLMKEIEKCDILCANCHRKLHWNDMYTSL